MIQKIDETIGVIGLGYVGLPLAVAFSKHHTVIGFDLNLQRIEELNRGFDKTGEVSMEGSKPNENIFFTSDIKELKECSVYIIAVPTPIDSSKNPDLNLLKSASKLTGSILNKTDLVIYESTVYPGCTEEICVPILQETSGLEYNRDFFVGYSPERINPGDSEHNLTSILKITSGSTTHTSERVDNLYKTIIKVGTHKVSSIKVAEAAKVIENTQRDVNIALINELAQIFYKLDLDTSEVLEAASTKWNFLSFHPGLVGGHCIGVDPYYLTYKSKELGIDPQIVLAGRRTNDGMGSYVADRVKELITNKGMGVETSKVLICGFSFKPNISDIRNTGVFNVYNALKNHNFSRVDIYDPNVDSNEVANLYDFEMTIKPNKDYYDAILIAVSHNIFLEKDIHFFKSFCKKQSVIYDLNSIFPIDQTDGRL